MRDGITLKCTICNNENYLTKKNKKKTPEKIELAKFCNTCRKTTPHKEKK